MSEASPSAEECYAQWREDALVVGNSHFEEKWVLESGRIRLASLVLKKAGGSWLFEKRDGAGSARPDGLDLRTGRAHPQERESLQVGIRLDHPSGHRGYRMKIFPGLCGGLIETFGFEAHGSPSVPAPNHADGIEREEVSDRTHDAGEDASIGGFLFTVRHLLVSATWFIEQSDRHANFVEEKRWQMHPSEAPLRLGVNMVTLEDPATGDGLVFVLLAPSRLVRDAWSPPCDYSIETCRGDGGILTKLAAYPGSYPLAHLAYRGRRPGRAMVLHALQKALHVPDAGRDGLLLSNTWGDRGRADRIGEAFMIGEIEAAAALGVEVVQMDDGWQQGRSANTVNTGGVWNGFWSVPDFWEPDAARFPRGLAPVADAVRRHGLRLGLWYAPDSSNEMENWEKDASALLRYWREFDVCHFKLDAIKLHSLLAERRLHALLDRVRDGSGGRVLFDLDATAEHRTTYWGRVSGSTLFLENRYTDRGSYFPHQTLRALWTLAWHVWPPRLRLEFLNPLRNVDRYFEDPLRPSAYAPECLFAITMPASPLAWLENSALPAETSRRIAGLVAVWKSHRAAWHAGDVIPLGGEPDGYAWTGFLSAAEDRRSGYLLVFREGNENGRWQSSLPCPFEGDLQADVLAGEGSVDFRQGRVTVGIPEKLGFVFVRIAGSSARS